MSERTEHGIRVGPIDVMALAETRRASAIRVTIPDRYRDHWFDVEATPKGGKFAVVMRPVEQGGGEYERLTVMLPNGQECVIHGSERSGWFAMFRDLDGQYVSSASAKREDAP